MTAPEDVPRLWDGVVSTVPSRTTAGDDASAEAVVLSVEEVEGLLAVGKAEPLLLGYRPVPILYRQRWWHLPQGRDEYRPALPAAAAVFDACRTRLRAAAEARQSGSQGLRW